MRFGYAPIDNDHEGLLALAVQVEKLVASNSTPPEIRTKFKELGNYAIAHFGREERIMQKAQYPERLRHKHEHEEIIRWIAFLEVELAAVHSEVLEAATSQTLAFLNAWIVDHLTAFDEPLIRYLLSRTTADNSTTPPLASASKIGTPG